MTEERRLPDEEAALGEVVEVPSGTPMKTSIEDLTGRLRWRGQTLEQEWSKRTFVTYINCVSLNSTRETIEWRAVPSED